MFQLAVHSKIKINETKKYKNYIDINVSDLEFKDLPANNNTKITCNKITEYSNKVGELKIKLANEIKTAFYEEINIIIDNYNTWFEENESYRSKRTCTNIR